MLTTWLGPLATDEYLDSMQYFTAALPFTAALAIRPRSQKILFGFCRPSAGSSTMQDYCHMNKFLAYSMDKKFFPGEFFD